jgi:uncharacterized Rmd1/YagE family protein
LKAQFLEQFSFETDPKKEFRVHNDLLTLPSDDAMIWLSFIHAFAQSAKLSFFEDRA